MTITSGVEYGDPTMVNDKNIPTTQFQTTTPADQQPTPNRSLPTKNYSLEESDAPILDSFSETTEPINDPAVVKKKILRLLRQIIKTLMYNLHL